MSKSEKSVVLLRRPKESSTQTTGIGVYSELLEGVILSKGAKLHREYCKMDFKNGFFSFLFDGLVRPSLNMFKNRNNYDVYHATDDLCGFHLSHVKGKKIVTIHHVVSTEGDGRSLYIWFWKKTAKKIMKYADVILSISPQTTSELIEYGFDKNKIVTFYNPIRSIYYDMDIKPEFRIGCIGEFVPRKNFAAALSVFSKIINVPGFENLRMTVCGKGMLNNEIHELAESLNIVSNIDFVSGLSEDEIVTLYNSISVLLTSSLHEGLGLTTLEAQKCGTPVVYFDYADIPSDVVCKAVPCKDEDDMVSNIIKLFENEDFRKSTINSAKEYADSFGSDFSENIAKVYEL